MCTFLLLCNYSCPHFPPLLSTSLPTPTSHIQSSPTLLSLSMGPLYKFLDLTLLLLCPIIPPSPLVTVSLFFISRSLVLFCSLFCFVDQVSLIGKIIWYLSFTNWLMSLSIILYSIHVVGKGRISFLLSAEQYSIV